MNQLPPAFTATIDSAIAELTKIRAGLTEQIFSEVTRLTGITRDEMCSRSRKREIIIARHGAVWLMKQNTTLTLKQIGALFGRRDHSTVLHAIDCVEDCPPLDRSFRWMANVVLVSYLVVNAILLKIENGIITDLRGTHVPNDFIVKHNHYLDCTWGYIIL